MAGEAFEIMKRASIFMILAQTVIYFRPQESYEKYLRFLIHLMLIAVLFFPVVELLNRPLGNRMQNSLTAYTQQMESLIDGAQLEQLSQEEAYISTIQNEVKIRLNNYCEQTGYIVESAEIQGYTMDGGHGQNGAVRLYITARPSSSAISTIQVDKIKWTGNNVERKESAQEQKLKEVYAKILGMEQYHVEVIADEVD